MYDDLEGDILLLNPRDEYFTCIMGDFNARTGQLDDFVEVDESILDVQNSDYVFDEDVCGKNMLMSFKIQCQRICKDKGKNTCGDKLLSLCKSNNFLIFNGRVGQDKYLGNFTTTKGSIVDYVIGSAHLLPTVNEFNILDFDPMFSDIHCPIQLSLHQPMVIDTGLNAQLSETPNNDEPSCYKWSHDKMEDFVNDIDVNMVNAILSELDYANNHNVN